MRKLTKDSVIVQAYFACIVAGTMTILDVPTKLGIRKLVAEVFGLPLEQMEREAREEKEKEKAEANPEA